MTTESLLGDAATTTASADQTTADVTATAAAQTDASTTSETKPEATAADTTKTEAKTDAPQGAPETYADFVMPEGVSLDKEMLGEFTPVLKELNLPQDAAQKVIDFAPKLVARTVASIEEARQAEVAGWIDASKTDKEFGGDKFAENLAVANKAFETFGNPELRAALVKTGMGNHPELLRAFYRAGKAISEDSFVAGGKANAPKPFYENSNMTR